MPRDWTGRFKALGAAMFVGSLIVGLPVFGIGWTEPHHDHPETGPLWQMPL